MPRYFFHIFDREKLTDEDGTTLANREEARAHAITIAGEILRDAGRKFWTGNEWRLLVTDETGANVCRVRFLVDDIALS
ncbi:hypothetical protein DC522_19950 [Microvirga sp. KLBC 81]|uniref:DUF6894 family protein n=1 Tax=Microvirga sp. KLBC 81 TaxID=1862707 RepID=UPI000D517B71|nr:hypothetical protein [Microvirga sp. KLBC 81]PVE22699.1 hypothetical protein DC522_19950 [Microvirga sp. KLBC 81]